MPSRPRCSSRSAPPTSRRHLRAARLPSVPRRPGARAAAEGHLPGLRPHAAHLVLISHEIALPRELEHLRRALPAGLPRPHRAPGASSSGSPATGRARNGSKVTHRPQVARAADREPRRPVAPATPSGWRARRSSTTARCCRATCRRSCRPSTNCSIAAACSASSTTPRNSPTSAAWRA